MGNVWEEQRQLLRRVERLVRLIRRDLCYRGSKDTADLGGAVHERLLRSPALAEKFQKEPEQLRGLLRTVVKHVLIDEIRYRAGQKRVRPEDEQVRVEWLARHAVGSGASAEPDEMFDRQRDVQRVLLELERFRAGDDDKRFSAVARERMCRALILHWEGNSQEEIAQALDAPKSTIGHNINTLSVLLAKRVAHAEHTPLGTAMVRPSGQRAQAAAV